MSIPWVIAVTLVFSCVGVLANHPLVQRQSTYTESITGPNQIGAHFGVPGIAATYDYVVVGGGTADLAVASRLAENSSCSVAVVEAGNFYELTNGNFTEVPAYAGRWLEPQPVIRNPLVDWYQFLTPQEQLSGQSTHYASGKTLGGGSARNFLWYQSAKGAYDVWANLTQDDSYTLSALDPFFKKSVNFHPPADTGNATISYDTDAYASPGGPVSVSYPAWLNGISSYFTQAYDSVGIHRVPGFTDGNLLGYSYIGFTLTTDEERSTSVQGYLREALEMTTNLQVYPQTLAKKITFDESGTAKGVLVNSGGFGYQLNASKEVIVSAGAFRSPQLLMVSGIGPKEQLDAAGVPVVQALEGVGQNLWDHILSGAAAAVDLQTHSQLTADPQFFAESVASYNNDRTGILTNSGADLLAFEKLPPGSLRNATRADLDATFTPDWPDIELVAFDNTLVSQPTDGRNYANSLFILVAPFSRGNVTLNGTDTSVNPIVDPGWLSDPRDQEVAIAGFKRARQVLEAEPLSRVTDGPEAAPGPDTTTDEQILSFLKLATSTVSHAAGTCKMGIADDPPAVIDSKARVLGVQGLRVVDASSLPILPPGHPQGTIYALAEKIAQDILDGN